MLASAVAEPESVKLQVDTEVHVPSDVTPRRVLDAIRRQLRQHDLPADVADELRRLLNLVRSTRDGSRLPQALLPRVTETCRRYGVPFRVVDRRAMVSCPALRSRLTLSPSEDGALRPMLVRDSGVLVAADRSSREALALELTARRQQRTLVAAVDPSAAAAWIQAFATGLDLPPPHVAALDRATADTWIAVARYDELAALPPEALSHDYGMVVCDGLCEVDAVTLMRTIRGLGARYLLGLARDAVRDDGVHNSLFLALGGVVHRMAAPRTRDPLRLTLQTHASEFRFDGYQGKKQYQALLAALARNPDRAQLVADDVVREASDGHACLVLSERRDHLELLAGLLPPELRCETLTSTVRPAERQRIIARFEGGELDVLLSTGQIAAEALATPHLQRLFLTFPFSYARKLEQVVRSLMQPSPGQISAVVHDYDDLHVDPLHRAFVKRAEFLGRLRRASEQKAQLALPL